MSFTAGGGLRINWRSSFICRHGSKNTLHEKTPLYYVRLNIKSASVALVDSSMLCRLAVVMCNSEITTTRKPRNVTGGRSRQLPSRATPVATV
jgi:hypothetical protein